MKTKDNRTFDDDFEEIAWLRESRYYYKRKAREAQKQIDMLNKIIERLKNEK